MIDFLKEIFGGHDVFIIGGGPSLIGFDFSLLKERKTIAINHSYEFVEDVNLMCCLDGNFKAGLARKGHRIPDFNFPVLCGPQAWDSGDNCYNIQTRTKDPLQNCSTDLYVMNKGGSTSAALAISAAIFAGATKIYLLGIDLGFDEDGNKHFYSNDFINRGIFEKDLSQKDRLDTMHQTFEKFSIYGDRIINLSLNSKLNTFKKIDITEVLKNGKKEQIGC